MDAYLIPFLGDTVVGGTCDGEPFSHHEVLALRHLATLVLSGHTGERLHGAIKDAVLHRGIARMAVEIRGER